MDVEEEWFPGRVALQPAPDPVVEDPGGQVSRRALARPFGVQVKLGEATIETVGARRQRVRHERRGAISARAESFGQRHDIRQECRPNVDRAVMRRRPAGQQRCRRGQRPRALRDGVTKDDRRAREGVDPWRRRPGIAVAAEPVGAQRIDDVQDHVRRIC